MYIITWKVSVKEPEHKRNVSLTGNQESQGLLLITPPRTKPTLCAMGIKPRVLHMLQTKQLLHYKTVSLAIFLFDCFILRKYLAKLSRLALNSL